MNELVVRRGNLPSLPTETVKMYVDVIGDAIADLKAKLDAAIHTGVDGDTVAEMQRQINEYTALQRQAEVELGKRTMEMEKSKGGYPKLFQGSEEHETKTKSEQLADLGIAPQRANEYETMAKNEDIVNRYIEESLADGKAPSKKGAIAAIKEEQSYITEDGTTPKQHNKGLVPGGFSKERREQRSQIEAIYDGLKSEPTIEFDAESLVKELNYIVDGFIGSIKSTLTIHSTLIDEVRGQVKEIITEAKNKIEKEVISIL